MWIKIIWFNFQGEKIDHASYKVNNRIKINDQFKIIFDLYLLNLNSFLLYGLFHACTSLILRVNAYVVDF